ncbi:Vitamin B12 import ATP-binding protein BtuD [Paenibacillus solanacearum]|uniref:Vitamin B12 import ATP-binding protein BtuD n=1 Tax=Paenibacillus solanacearum TaxID=2048548 RepID=A0A916K1R0_9BACL|nr:ABC transporter ATP-binding protein [Paenibacillus solanacearum]CAG7628331.1 Vitamin B12 import ATP-binding protein BtuD [Paenibacillus solanacearum]
MDTRVPKVKVSNISKQFTVSVEDKEQTIRALDNVSFSVHAGEIVALAGTSGCGKTTMLRILMGLEQASSGTVEIDGNKVNGPGFDRGMIFQHAGLLPWRSALENVEYGLEVKNMPKQQRRVVAEHYLELVGLKNFMHHRPNQLSGGMQQRVGIARALAIDPEVLLMDEPFGALDAQTRESMQEELLRIQQQTSKTILFVTHDLDEAVLLADKVLVMFPGPGRIHEIVDIQIPHPRTDTIAIRGSDEFNRKRYHIWKTLKTSSALQTNFIPAEVR